MFLIYYFIAVAVLASLAFVLKKPQLNPILATLFLAVELGMNYYTVQNIGAEDSIYFRFDHLAVILTTVGTIVSIPTFYHSFLYLRRRREAGLETPAHEGMYYACLMMLLASMNMTYFAGNLGLLWAFMEATTIFLSLLIYHERQKTTLEATWKYVFISSVGVALAFIGILFLSVGLTRDGVTDLDINHIIAHAANLNPLWIKISFVLLLVGLSGKMGVFPFHTISIDALAVAPPPITALVGSALKGVGFVGIFRIYSIISQTQAHAWANNVLLLMGIISVLIAAVEMSKVKFFPRLLGYSSLEHMGLLLICLSLGKLGYFVAVFHIILHSFAKASFFLQMGQVHDIYDSNRMVKCGEYFRKYPFGAITVIFGFLTMTAMPPSGLFVSEVLAFQVLFQTNHFYLAIGLFLAITLVIYFFAKNILELLFSPAKESTPHSAPEAQTIPIYRSETFSQWMLMGLVFYIGFFTPDFLIDWIQTAVSVLHY